MTRAIKVSLPISLGFLDFGVAIMVNSRYERAQYEYEIATIPASILAELNERLSERADLVSTATEEQITPSHLSWIRSFEGLIREIDPLGEIDTWSHEHSDSLVRQWHDAQYGGNYSPHDIETRRLSEKYLETQRFHAYLAVLEQLRRGKARIVKAKKFLPISSDNEDASAINIESNKIFIVHGHDELALAKVASFIRAIGLEPIILHEQSNAGHTIIEKLERHTTTKFAIVIYTGCDRGSSNESPDIVSDRARQNVVFEHGYLVSKIGRGNVCALVKGGVEIPSDLSGLVYVTLDDHGAWRLEVARELRASGLAVDMNRVV